MMPTGPVCFDLILPDCRDVTKAFLSSLLSEVFNSGGDWVRHVGVSGGGRGGVSGGWEHNCFSPWGASPCIGSQLGISPREQRRRSWVARRRFDGGHYSEPIMSTAQRSTVRTQPPFVWFALCSLPRLLRLFCQWAARCWAVSKSQAGSSFCL